MKHLAVFCGASVGSNDLYRKEALKVADFMADRNIAMVYGGGKIGLMGVMADRLIQRNVPVIGVIPKLLKTKEVAHPDVSEMIYTETMSERKVIMSLKCDAYIALAGGFGTLDEIFEALTMGQLGIESKPVAFLNTGGFYDHLMKQLDFMVHEGFLKPLNRDLIIISDSIEEIFDQINDYKAPKVTKVINTTPDYEE